MMVADDEIEAEGPEELGNRDDEIIDDVEISIHALSGNTAHNTIRIQAKVRGVPVTVLIDSGSTNSFIDPKIPSRCGEVMQPTKPMVIRVTDGNQLFSNATFPSLK